MTKREKVVWLLEHMHDWIPGPRTATGSIVQSSTTPGETPSKTIDCPVCKGTGKRGREVCDECDRGVIVIDDYTGRVAGAAPETAADVALERRERRRKVDREIERLRSQVRGGGSDMDVTGDTYTAAVEAKERLDRSGSFRELYACIDRLQLDWPMHAYALLLTFSPDGSHPVDLPKRETLVRATELAIDCITSWMPAEVRVPRWALNPSTQTCATGKGRWANPSQQARRNDRIYTMIDSGYSPTEIGQELGLDRAQVTRILAARPVASQGMVA